MKTRFALVFFVSCFLTVFSGPAEARWYSPSDNFTCAVSIGEVSLVGRISREPGLTDSFSRHMVALPRLECDFFGVGRLYLQNQSGWFSITHLDHTIATTLSFVESSRRVGGDVAWGRYVHSFGFELVGRVGMDYEWSEATPTTLEELRASPDSTGGDSGFDLTAFATETDPADGNTRIRPHLAVQALTVRAMGQVAWPLVGGWRMETGLEVRYIRYAVTIDTALSGGVAGLIELFRLDANLLNKKLELDLFMVGMEIKLAWRQLFFVQGMLRGLPFRLDDSWSGVGEGGVAVGVMKQF